MSDRKIETMKGMCAVDITKYLMKEFGISADAAYSKFMKMELYNLLMDTGTGLYLEQNEFLFECCSKEIYSGKEGLYCFLEAI